MCRIMKRCSKQALTCNLIFTQKTLIRAKSPIFLSQLEGGLEAYRQHKHILADSFIDGDFLGDL